MRSRTSGSSSAHDDRFGIRSVPHGHGSCRERASRPGDVVRWSGKRASARPVEQERCPPSLHVVPDGVARGSTIESSRGRHLAAPDRQQRRRARGLRRCSGVRRRYRFPRRDERGRRRSLLNPQTDARAARPHVRPRSFPRESRWKKYRADTRDVLPVGRARRDMLRGTRGRGYLRRSGSKREVALEGGFSVPATSAA